MSSGHLPAGRAPPPGVDMGPGPGGGSRRGGRPPYGHHPPPPFFPQQQQPYHHVNPQMYAGNYMHPYPNQQYWQAPLPHQFSQNGGMLNGYPPYPQQYGRGPQAIPQYIPSMGGVMPPQQFPRHGQPSPVMPTPPYQPPAPQQQQSPVVVSSPQQPLPPSQPQPSRSEAVSASLSTPMPPPTPSSTHSSQAAPTPLSPVSSQTKDGPLQPSLPASEARVSLPPELPHTREAFRAPVSKFSSPIAISLLTYTSLSSCHGCLIPMKTSLSRARD
jgi:hypothetical protein